MSSVNPVKEFFLLERASAEAKAMPEERRTALGHELGVARQRAQAADALWTLGHTAEGLRLVAESLDATLSAVERVHGPATEVAAPSPQAPEPKAESASESDASDAETDTDASESESEGTSDSDSAADASDDETDSESSEPESVGPDAERTPEADASDAATADGVAPAASPSWSEILRARGLAPELVSNLATLHGSIEVAKLPALDADVSAADHELFREVLSSQRRVERVLLPAAMTPAQVTRTKVLRWAGAGIIVVLGVVGLYFALRTPRVVAASASAHYASSPEFMPDLVVDGDTETEWLLPDRATGWVEISLSPPRNISNLRLRNASNPPYFDRATENYTIEAFADGEEVLSQQGSWDSVDRDPDWVQIPVNADGVERIRFTVRSHHETGAGLSEIEWDER